MNCTSGVEMVLFTRIFAVTRYAMRVMTSSGYLMRLITMVRQMRYGSSFGVSNKIKLVCTCHLFNDVKGFNHVPFFKNWCHPSCHQFLASDGLSNLQSILPTLVCVLGF